MPSAGGFEYRIDRIDSIQIGGEWYSAFLATELGEMLPEWIRIVDDDEEFIHELWMEKDGGIWSIDYMTGDRVANMQRFRDESEADARGAMVAYLIEHKLLSIESLK